MYVKPTKSEYKNKERTLYGNLERRFYAFQINRPPQVLDMWDQNNKREKQLIDAGNFNYFIINTMVGIGSKNDLEKIKRVHIRFAFWPFDKKKHEPEILLIYPSYISRTVGQVYTDRNMETQTGYGIGGRTSGGFTSANLRLGLSAFFNSLKKSSLRKKATSTLPNEILITNASGCGNHAIWEFHKGEGIEDVGQYNLEIIFRIPADQKFVDETYYVDWNIEINGRPLIDHDDDLEDDDNKGNPEQGKRKLMRKIGSKNGKAHGKNNSYEDKYKIKLENRGRLDKLLRRKYKDKDIDDLRLPRELQLVKIDPPAKGIFSFLQYDPRALPSTSVIAEDGRVKVIAELPGVNKENISITAHDEILEIDAEGLLNRRYHRLINLIPNLDMAGAKSTFRNGLLEVVFNNKSQTNSKGKEIKVE